MMSWKATGAYAAVRHGLHRVRWARWRIHALLLMLPLPLQHHHFLPSLVVKAILMLFEVATLGKFSFTSLSFYRSAFLIAPPLYFFPIPFDLSARFAFLESLDDASFPCGYPASQ